MIQFILIVALAFLAISLVKSRNTSKTKAYKKLLLLLFIPCAIIVVLFPDIATRAANILGVGRGADLLLYGVTVVLIFVLFNTYIKDIENQNRTVVLARKIAIIEAREKYKI